MHEYRTYFQAEIPAKSFYDRRLPHIRGVKIRFKAHNRLLRELETDIDAVTLDGKELSTYEYSAKDRLLWIRFTNKAERQDVAVHF